jgi:hypothetical protein
VSFLAVNLEALARRFPELADLIDAAEAFDLAVATASTGETTARVPGGAWLHSSRDPRSEARRLVAASAGPGIDVVVLLGFGLGYGAEACLEAGIERVIVCETSVGALKAAFSLRDLSALLADEHLGFLVGEDPEGLVSALELSGGSRAGILELKAATATNPEWYGGARRAAERWNAKESVNESTLRRFGRLWVRNLARNLGTAASSPGVECLERVFSGLPAIILAAGPSLDLVLPRMREISRRALVVCVDTALRSLLRAGPEPDFLVVVDPQYWNWRHIAGLSSPSSFLVSEAACWPAVFRAAYRGTFLGGSLFPLGRRIEQFAGSKGRLGAGGSVATGAWDLGRIMGCAPLWMAGLDLSFPDGQTHARASLFEQRALASGSRLAPASGAQAATLVDGQSFDALASDGRKVRTDSRMSLYAWWFESRFSRPSSPRTFSLSPCGLAVNGLCPASIEELLACPDRREEIQERLVRITAIKASSDSRTAVASGLLALRAELESIALRAESASAVAREGRSTFAEGRDCRPHISILEEADADLLRIEARDVAGFLLPPIAEVAGRKARDLGESFAQSEALYRELAESARYHLEALATARID